MKAAVMYKNAAFPQYTDIPEPIATKSELLINVKAVAIKNVDKSLAAGKHYSAPEAGDKGRVVGSDGVGLLANGTRVYGMGAGGMLAEQALIHPDHMVHIPQTLDDATAAALPNAVIGAAMGLKFKAHIKAGDTVLINGATGVTGRIAVQTAKYYGAAKVIATGRNEQALKELTTLGADELIVINNDDTAFKDHLKRLHAASPINIIIDYLWGHSAEMILSCLMGNGRYAGKISYVSVGSMAGNTIQLSTAVLRSTGLQLSGSGLGAWPDKEIDQLFKEILPEMFALAANGKLKIETLTMPLNDIDQLWNMDIPTGQRLVITV